MNYWDLEFLGIVEDSDRIVYCFRKGKLRNAMEALLMDYHRKGEIRVVIPRFADFYGPNVVNDLYGRIFRSAIDGKTFWKVSSDPCGCRLRHKLL